MNAGIVDSHQHFWQVGRFDYPWMSSEVEALFRDYLPPALEPVLKQGGVEKTILVQASNSLEETRWLLSLSAQYPFIAGVVGWIDLTGPDVEPQLAEFLAHPKFKGVRHLVESEPADDLLIHLRHLKYVDTLAQNCPGLRLVVDHLAKPPIASGQIGEWSREIKVLA